MSIRRRLAGGFPGTLLLALLPSFVAEVLQPGRHRKPVKLHSTSYLDGLRGIAAFVVFMYHYTDYNHKSFLPLYGRNPRGEGSSLLQLPYIRIIYSGKPMVHIFFVISGFVLAYRPLQCLYGQRPSATFSSVQQPRSGSIAKCHAALASSAFRRPIRLFGPPLVLTLADVILVRFGYLYNVVHPQMTLWAQLSEWVQDTMDKVIWPWGWDERPSHSMYNPHLWTIPVEFTHSMLLFLVLFAIARLRTPALRRIALVLCMVYMFLLCARWAGFEFLAGALLADFHIAAEHAHRATSHTSRQGIVEAKSPKPNVLILATALAPYFVLAVAGYLFSWPPRVDGITPNYVRLMMNAPTRFGPERAHYFYWALAAVGTVWACGRLTGLRRRVLESAPAQYAGRISFAVYIVQHTVLNISMLARPRAVEAGAGAGATGESSSAAVVLPWYLRGFGAYETPVQRTVCWAMGLCVIGSILVWVADVFSRLVDVPIARAARALEAKVFARDEDDGDVLPTNQI